MGLGSDIQLGVGVGCLALHYRSSGWCLMPRGPHALSDDEQHVVARGAQCCDLDLSSSRHHSEAACALPGDLFGSSTVRGV